MDNPANEMWPPVPMLSAPADGLRDGLLAHFSALTELNAYPAPGVTPREGTILGLEQQKRREEQAAHAYLTTFIDSLIPPNKLHFNFLGGGVHAGIVSDLETLKRLQSVIFYPYNSTSYQPPVIIGSAPSSSPRYSLALSYNLVYRKVRAFKVNSDDLAAFQRLPMSSTTVERSEQDILHSMTSDGQLLLDARTPHTICNKPPEGMVSATLRGHRKTDLTRYGFRIEGSPIDGVLPEVELAFAQGRLSRHLIERFDIPQHLARLAGALSADNE
jgi:hypothetical protein